MSPKSFFPFSYKLLFYLLVFLSFFFFSSFSRGRERGNFIRYSFHSGGRKRWSRKFASCFKSRICFTFSQRDVRSTNKSRKSGYVTQTERRNVVLLHVFLCNFVSSSKSSRVSIKIQERFCIKLSV